MLIKVRINIVPEINRFCTLIAEVCLVSEVFVKQCSSSHSYTETNTASRCIVFVELFGEQTALYL